MRSALILLVAAFLTVPASALAENHAGPTDTVRVLVPDRNYPGASEQSDTRRGRSGWIRIEAPLHGRGAAAIPQALAALGPEAILENVYRWRRPPMSLALPSSGGSRTPDRPVAPLTPTSTLPRPGPNPPVSG